ncbi:hypothetical protein G9C85_13905 [Halorubellus sp. JP-L1]|nr:hypothetical protein [Halorubellus sp. JP-L1]
MVAASAAVALALVHLYGTRIRLVDAAPRSRILSFGGGVSVAYVFVHLLPELARTEGFDETPLGHPLVLERSVHVVALLGFVTFYGLERFVAESRDDEVGEEPSRGVYRIHLASFAGYNALVGYLLFHREEAGTIPLVLFAVAMTLHFLVNDYALRHHYRDAYRDRGRWVLAAAVLGGALAGALTTIDRGALDVLFAFLAGGVVLNTIKEELPESRESKFVAFALGNALYAGLLLLV